MPSHERWVSKFRIKEHSWVFVPTYETIQYGLTIKHFIEEKWIAPRYYYHFRSGGHIKALQEHIQNTYFLHLDIQNFFGHINRSKITRCIKHYFPYKKAREIAIRSTVRLPESTIKRYILPFGFVQSPILSSVCLSKSALGHQLSKIANRNDFVVSVYMDDIIISGNNPDALNKQLELLKPISVKSDLPLNPKKQTGPGHSITAFNICVTHGLLKITSERFNKLLHTHSLSTNEHQKRGILSYVLSVNPEQAASLIDT